MTKRNDFPKWPTRRARRVRAAVDARHGARLRRKIRRHGGIPSTPDREGGVTINAIIVRQVAALMESRKP